MAGPRTAFLGVVAATQIAAAGAPKSALVAALDAFGDGRPSYLLIAKDGDTTNLSSGNLRLARPVVKAGKASLEDWPGTTIQSNPASGAMTITRQEPGKDGKAALATITRDESGTYKYASGKWTAALRDVQPALGAQGKQPRTHAAIIQALASANVAHHLLCATVPGSKFSCDK